MVLPIFPAQALDSSVITTVWVGLCVITFFNLRFGMTLAGLVVPGYLVPLLLIKPMSATVIWAEAIVTYLLARLLADKVMRWSGSCTMFGRDRFFALLLTSVLVRTVSDGWLLPALGEWLSGQGYAFDYHNNLHSFGLVIIALTANQMWNSGMVRGMGTFVLQVSVTFAIVRWVLMPFTNFDISSLGFLYEDIASDILASPKGYLILLTTAFIASRLNLAYGWEFSGILIPALLALQWFQPTKLLVSMLEAGLIFGLGHLALKLPIFRRMNMEGARLLLLFFTLGYLYKLVFGHLLTWVAPSVKATDYFAFGYLLSTLLAVKMHQKQISWQLSRTTLQASLMGLVVASVVGYGLVLAMPPGMPETAQRAPAQRLIEAESTLVAALAAGKRTLYASEDEGRVLEYDARDLRAFGDGVRSLLRYRDQPGPAALQRAHQRLADGGFELDLVGDWILVRDQHAGRGSGLFAINLRPRTTLAVEVPMPLDEPGVFEAAAQLAQVDGHATFASGGTRRSRLEDDRSHVLRNPDLPFARFHALTAAGGVLQLRGMDTPPGVEAPAQLWIQRELPRGLDLEVLRARTGDLRTQFGRRDAANPLRDATAAPFAELMLGRPMRLRLIARTLAPAGYQRLVQEQRVDGFLYATLVERREAVASAGSERYEVPELGDLLYLQAEVLEPLYQVAMQWDLRRDEDLLHAISAAASSLGYSLVLHRHQRSGEEHVILTENPGSQRRWGTYVLRMGQATPYLVEIPRPLAERQTFEYGTRLFTRIGARGLLIAGAHPAVRGDGLGDVLAEGNPRTVFNLAHQVLVPSLEAPWVLQVRGRRDEAIERGPDVVATFVGKPAATADRGRLDALLKALGGDADAVALGGSSAAARDGQAGYDAQSAFTRKLPRVRFMTLWVSARARRGYADALLDDSDRARFAALQVPTEAVDLRARLSSARFGAAPDAAQRGLVDEYVRTRNVASLVALQASGLELLRVVDLDSGRVYLELRGADGRSRAIRAMDPALDPRRTFSAGVPRQRLAFLEENGAWLQGAAR